jgi:acylphosphatase
VQGIYFRAFTEREARDLGLRGWVRNLPSGREVEVLAEGRRRDLETLLRFLHHGPPGALIESVDVHWGPAQGGLPQAFRVVE